MCFYVGKKTTTKKTHKNLVFGLLKKTLFRMYNRLECFYKKGGFNIIHPLTWFDCNL